MKQPKDFDEFGIMGAFIGIALALLLAILTRQSTLNFSPVSRDTTIQEVPLCLPLCF